MPYGDLRRIILFSLDLFLGLIPKPLIYLIYRNWLHSNFAHKEIIKPFNFQRPCLSNAFFIDKIFVEH